jgi:hypothetical protein
MPFVKAMLSTLAGVLTGLIIGYVLWGVPTADLSGALARTSAELDKTKAWLLDEIQTSDEKHTQLSTKLTQALSDLAKARAELARGSVPVPQKAANDEVSEPARR